MVVKEHEAEEWEAKWEEWGSDFETIDCRRWEASKRQRASEREKTHLRACARAKKQINGQMSIV